MDNRNRWLMALMLIVALVALLPGQSMNGRVVGQVKDENGNSLPGVKVEATNITSNAVSTSISGKKGTFRLMALLPGTYQVSFDLEGFQPYVASGIRISAEQSITLRIKLKKAE